MLHSGAWRFLSPPLFISQYLILCIPIEQKCGFVTLALVMQYSSCSIRSAGLFVK